MKNKEGWRVVLQVLASIITAALTRSLPLSLGLIVFHNVQLLPLAHDFGHILTGFLGSDIIFVT